MNRTFSLLVGINTYPGAELDGCVPDIKLSCNNLASDAFGASGRGMNWDCLDACTDGRAHAEGFRNRIARLVAGAVAGDRLLLWYSGHGAQVATRDSVGEVDGMLETLCPYDFTFDDPDTWITDIDFLETFGQLAAGVSCTIVLDSCFSGGMAESAKARGMNHCKPRVWPKTSVDFDVRRRAAGVKGHTVRSISRSILNKVVIISACLERQTAADAVINGQPDGAFSYFFWDSVLEDLDRPLQDTVKVTANKLAKAGFEQVPAVTGPKALLEAPFLSGL